MLFREFFTLENLAYETMKQKYGDDVVYGFRTRFYDYELLYGEDAMNRLFISTMYECHLELLKMKKYFGISEFGELGTTITNTSTMDTNSTSNSTQSYQGYNVEGDFSKNASTGTTNGTNSSTSKSINLTDENLKIYQFDFAQITDKVFSKFVNLFIIVL